MRLHLGGKLHLGMGKTLPRGSRGNPNVPSLLHQTLNSLKDVINIKSYVRPYVKCCNILFVM